MGHLTYGCLSRQRKLKYYRMIERVCAGNMDTAQKLYCYQDEKTTERATKRGGKPESRRYTIAELFTRELLHIYATCGNDYDRAMRWVGKSFARMTRRRIWAAQEAAARVQPQPAPQLTDDQVLIEGLINHYNRVKALWDKQPASLEKLAAAQKLVLMAQSIEAAKAYVDSQAATSNPQPQRKEPAPIEVKFKHPTDRGANSNTAQIKDGQPIAQIKAGGDAESFWRGVLFTMEFSKEQQ